MVVRSNLRAIFGHISRSRARWVFTGSLFVALFFSTSALAAGYGQTPYGTCAYGQACAPSTVVTLPSAPASSSTPTPLLQVNINLQDGQIIPRSGYTIVVTPLNGQGASFASIDFYIGNALVHSQSPDEEGTVSWFWDVSQLPGTVIRIVVHGQDGQTVSQTFNVTLAAAKSNLATSPARAAPTTSPSLLQQIIATPHHLVQSVTRSVARLPRQVKYGLPYFLFLILGGDMVFLFIRARHEVMEARRGQTLLARERQTGELKHTFLQLVSHYLRTPLTIINGGLELTDEPTTAGPVKAAHTHAQLLGGAIEDLLEQLSKQDTIATPQAIAVVSRRSVWRQVAFYVPIGLIGVIAACFDYLAHHGGSFNLGEINLIVQLVIFGSLSVVIYQALRYWQLKQRERQTTAHILEQEVTFTHERDQVIDYGATQIKGLIDKIAAEVAQIQSPDVKRIAQQGTTQLQTVAGKLLIANELHGSTSAQPYVSVSLKDLVQQALTGIEDQLTRKAIQLQTLHDTTIRTRSNDLLVFVVRTILDNAIAYSLQGGVIEIDAAVTRETVSITVRDQGVGIAEDKKFSLFQAFSKTEGAELFNHEGMGFSLYLDKLIMNYLVGDIRVESTPQQGTTVTLSLPQPLETA